jgi:RNA polymerase sigma factor (sigma-70 family)
MQNEIALIQECIRGNKKSQQKLYESYHRKMFVIALRYSKTRLDAEDILQEAFIKVFANLGNFRQDCPLEAWVKRIVVNTALKHNRSKLYAQPQEDILEMENQITDGDFSISQYHFKELLAMIQKLPLKCQMVFNLYAIEGYQHAEIAQMLDISEGTSKSQYSRAKTLLQSMILENEEVRYVGV